MLQAFCVITLCIAGQKSAAFAPIKSEFWARRLALHLQKSSHDRRTFLAQQTIAPMIASMATLTTIAPNPVFADALLMEKSSLDVPAFQGGASEAKQRFRSAIKDIDNLLANYDEITKSGGDNVRLYLGTQGVKSNMYGIMKVLKLLKEEADDIVEYTEAMNEFEAYLFQAEGAAYQSMFVEHSSAKSTPESLLKTARGDIVNMRKYMGIIALQLSLDA
mmetsp:Transcript_8176/g.20104  ORF Transcript_8176/g.20104 Transcript_8176/m.20104 type:complete len:219 (+) Transcript_8176:90-746(+)